MYQNLDTSWWTVDEKDQFKSVFGYVLALDTKQSNRQNANIRNMRLYGSADSPMLQGYRAFRAEPTAALQHSVTLNIVQSMVDTVVSKITKNRPKATFLTEGGDWSLQRKAQKLSQFVEGQFQAVDYYSKATMSFQDACIFGTGPLKIFKQEGKICVDRVFIDEIQIDDNEALYGEPRQMHQKKYIHKDVLVGMFPEHESTIMMLGQTPSEYGVAASFDEATNMVLVIESWHLPSSKASKDGLHTICIENCTLFSEEWTKDYFPFVWNRWSVRPLGFFGQGLAEQLTGLQLEINKILRTIQISMHLVSVPKLLVEASAQVVASHLNNKIGGIIKYVGTPPAYAPLGQIPAELFTHLDRLYTRAYEIAGVSQLSAQSAKPAGLDSGKALREFNDIETERFLAVGRRYEKTFLDAARIMIDIAKELDEELPGGYKVRVTGAKYQQTLAWKDVNMDSDMYSMQIFPVSALSSTPSGRLADVQELLAAGFIGKEDGMKLLDFPDLQQFYNFNNAGVEDIERAIELIIDSSDYQTPEPYQNLVMGVQKMQQAYLYYRANGAPEEKLELFRRWMEDANSLLKKASEAAAPPQAAMPEAPLPPEATLGDPNALEAGLADPSAVVTPLA
jgi:hypothetical protein